LFKPVIKRCVLKTKEIFSKVHNWLRFRHILRSSDISGYHSGAATDTSLLARHAVHEDEGTSTFETSGTIHPPSRPTALDSSATRRTLLLTFLGYNWI